MSDPWYENDDKPRIRICNAFGERFWVCGPSNANWDVDASGCYGGTTLHDAFSGWVAYRETFREWAKAGWK